jgi:NTP pyrophosphatase (non-canonical NTP hydrolase)
MELQDIVNLQKDFDATHQINFPWSEPVTEKNPELLSFLVLSLSGEVGELANNVKKVIRGDRSLSDAKNEISEELTDVFIYILKLSYQLDIDLEQAYLQKLNINRQRFKPFEK